MKRYLLILLAVFLVGCSHPGIDGMTEVDADSVDVSSLLEKDVLTKAEGELLLKHYQSESRGSTVNTRHSIDPSRKTISYHITLASNFRVDTDMEVFVWQPFFQSWRKLDSSSYNRYISGSHTIHTDSYWNHGDGNRIMAFTEGLVYTRRYLGWNTTIRDVRVYDLNNL